MRPLSIIGAPSSAGAYSPGQEKAPAAWRRHGLLDSLRASGREVHDRGDVARFRWRPDHQRPKAMNLNAVKETAQSVAAKVAAAFDAGHDVLVLGGDCTIELGTAAGARSQGGTLGLVYVDVDTDMNPPDKSDGALDWTGVAHLLSIPGASDELAGLGDVRPLLQPSDILCFAAGNVEPNERETISKLGIASIGLAEVQADPKGSAERAVAWAARFDTLLVHLDMDVLNFAAFPIAENTRRDIGLTLDQLTAVLSVLLAAPNLRGLTMTEVNPDHAPDEREMFAALIAMVTGALCRG